jgi:hypothetical protein
LCGQFINPLRSHLFLSFLLVLKDLLRLLLNDLWLSLSCGLTSKMSIFLAKRMHSVTVFTEVLMIEAGSMEKSRVS